MIKYETNAMLQHCTVKYLGYEYVISHLLPLSE